MIRTIFCFTIFFLLSHQAQSQTAIVDSLLTFYKSLGNSSNKNSPPCETRINAYKGKLKEINILDLDSTIKQFLTINDGLLKPVVKNCWRFDVVYRLDSMLKKWKHVNEVDSLQTLNAIAYVKYHLKDHTSLRILLADSAVQQSSPRVSIYSFETFVALPVNTNENREFEVLTLPGKNYAFHVSAIGYSNRKVDIIAPESDTTINVDLVKNETSGTDGGNTTPDDSTSGFSWKKYWWLLVILLAGAVWLLWKLLRPKSLERTGSGKNSGMIEQELLNKDRIIENSRKQIEKMHADNLSLVDKMKNTGGNMVGGKIAPSDRHFVSEILMT